MAKIVIDADGVQAGVPWPEHVLHTEVAPWNQVKHPTIPGQMIDMVDFILLMEGNKALQDAAGYSVKSNHPSAAGNKSRWQMIVEHSNGPNADPKLKGKLHP